MSDKQYWYRASRWGDIEKREITRTTRKMVWWESSFGGEKAEHKSSDSASWHKTWQAAKDWLVAYRRAQWDAAKLREQLCKEKYEEAFAMEEPAE